MPFSMPNSIRTRKPPSSVLFLCTEFAALPWLQLFCRTLLAIVEEVASQILFSPYADEQSGSILSNEWWPISKKRRQQNNRSLRLKDDLGRAVRRNLATGKSQNQGKRFGSLYCTRLYLRPFVASRFIFIAFKL
uniref:(northern house mosquito) hypothetical protein n=1 Tax=Culex pipiens TaxID=7175 RepID=A0A8D8B8G1_CULPI